MHERCLQILMKAVGELVLSQDRDSCLLGIPKCSYVVGQSLLSYKTPIAYSTLIGNASLLLKQQHLKWGFPLKVIRGKEKGRNVLPSF